MDMNRKNKKKGMTIALGYFVSTPTLQTVPPFLFRMSGCVGAAPLDMICHL